MESLFERSMHSPITLFIGCEVVLIAHIDCKGIFHEHTVMQMQYFKVIKQGFSVRPPPPGQRLLEQTAFFFFFWQQLPYTVAQWWRHNNRVQMNTTGINWTWCALCAFHFRNYPCGRWPCFLHISAQIIPQILYSAHSHYQFLSLPNLFIAPCSTLNWKITL